MKKAYDYFNRIRVGNRVKHPSGNVYTVETIKGCEVTFTELNWYKHSFNTKFLTKI